MNTHLSRRSLLGAGLFLGGAALLPGLTSCSSQSSTPGADEPLEFLAWDFQPDTVEALVKEWKTKTGNEINVSINALSGYASALQTRMQAGQSVDVFYNHSSNAKKYYAAEWASRLDDLEGIDKITADLFPSAKPMYQSSDGAVIALPYYSALHYTIYNKKYLEAAGITALPGNFDQLYSACEKLKKDNICATPYQGFWAKDGIAEWFINYMLNADVTVFSENHDPVFADDPNAVHVLQWWQEMFNSGLAPASTLTDDPGKLTSNLADGTTAFFSAHHYFLAQVRGLNGKYSGDDIGSMSSGFASHKTLQAGEVLQMGVIKDDKRRTKAWEFMRYYGSGDESGNYPAFQKWAEAAGLLAPYAGFFKNDQIRKAMSKTYDVDELRETFELRSEVVPTRFEIWYPTFATAIGEHIEDMLINKKDPKQTLDSLAKVAAEAKKNAS